jgi:hypothetical protein
VTELLPFDFSEILHTELTKERRQNDYLLHASSHLTGSLRHAQLEVAGAPTVGEELVRGMPLWIGSLIHEDVHRMLRKVGIPYMAEVNMTPWLPPGWGGTADALVWNHELKAFVLADFKTSKGESMRYIRKEGAKPEHVAQTSAYWWAAKKMGLPLAKAIGIYYLPKNDTRSKDELIEPVLIDFEPIPAKTLHGEMKRRVKRVDSYRNSLPESRPTRLEDWVTDELDPVQSREQRVYWNKTADLWDVKLVPHWSAGFCPFDAVLCDCGQQGTTKIGVYDEAGTYYPRDGYEEIEPTVAPPIG